MNTQQDLYEAEVKRIAGILNAKYWEDSENGIPPLDTEKDDPELWKQSRAMVQEMARQYQEGFNDGKLYEEESGKNVRNMEDELVVRGLIPTPKTTDHA